MHLSTFIRSNTETILVDWDAFAETILSSPRMSKEGLRDHADEMLLAIAKDIDTPQSPSEQAAKSRGVEASDKKESWAKAHGRARHAIGFDVNETVSEFRALRASVLSHWTKAATHITRQDLVDLTRFNEAIDQAVAESLKQYSTEKEMQDRLLGAVHVASPDPIGVLDLQGKYIYANQAMGNMFALPCEAIIGKTNAALRLPLAAEFQRHLRKVIAQQSACRGEATYRSSADEAKRYEYELAPVLDAQGCCEAIVCICRDITERAGLEEEARHSAHHDPLTGLPNRRLFLDRLDQAFKHAKRGSLPLALLYVDLDGFKEVNDRLGHEAGDRLLVDVAERLTECVRQDDSVARMGGDEFTIILSGATQRRDVELVAQLIIKKLAMPFHLAEGSVHVAASIGAALHPEHATSPGALIKAADEAMFRAKKSASNRFCFSGSSVQEATRN